MSLTIVATHSEFRESSLNETQRTSLARKGRTSCLIKQCEDDRGCGWLFVDDSRLKNRRWCSMGDCGNVAKARRHRARAVAAGRH